MKKDRESVNRPDIAKMESKWDLKLFFTDDQFKVNQKFMKGRKNRGG